MIGSRRNAVSLAAHSLQQSNVIKYSRGHIEIADPEFVGVAEPHADEDRIVIAIEDGKQIASFKVGDSNCVLKDGQIRCALG